MYTYAYKIYIHACTDVRLFEYTGKKYGGRGGANWLDYQSKIQKGGTYKDLQDHPFVRETTAGEDVK